MVQIYDQHLFKLKANLDYYFGLDTPEARTVAPPILEECYNE